MNEKEFTIELVNRLRPRMDMYQVETHKSLLYTLHIDENGDILINLNADGEPKRGGGSGFEQDILIYEHVDGKTTIVPRVAVEVKFRGVTTHDALVYSEKARRIRQIYPYIRYGMFLGDMEFVPPRVLRLGTEFDFIVTVGNPPGQNELPTLVDILLDELKTSHILGQILTGDESVSMYRKKINIRPPIM